MPRLEGTMLKERYRIDELIGRGGMAEVYKAWDMLRHYHVAIKLLRPDLAEDRQFDRRFRREALALARLAHRNIVRFCSFERDGPLAFIVIDLVAGTTLRRRIYDADGPLPADQVLAILDQVAAALSYAHASGVLHRDVKPGNIMIQPDPLAGTGGHVLVADFGIAKSADLATMTIVVPGTPAYMSPEQCQSRPVDTRTDVYSLGVVVYKMLAGRRPFLGETADITTGSTREKIHWEQVHAQPPPLRESNPTLPPAAERAVLRALAKAPEARWPTVLDFGRALEAALGAGRPEPVLTPSPAATSLAPASAAPPAAVPVPLPAPERDPVAADAPEPVATPAPPSFHARLRRLPASAWAAGGLALAATVLLVLILVITLGGSNRGRPTPAPAGQIAGLVTEAPATTVVAIEETMRTPTTTAAPTHHPTQTLIPTAAATQRSTKSSTNTETPTRSPAPTPMPTRAPLPGLGATWQRPANGMIMVQVPAGEFEMGSTDGLSDEKPPHTVALDGFWIDRTEVTNAQYRQCVEAGQCQPPRTCDWGEPIYGDESKADYPVVCVDWYGATSFCQGVGGRLPTEAEWEYAARGLVGTNYPWGITFDGQRANYCDDNCELDHRDSRYADGYARTAPVASYPAGSSWCNAQDMAGNAWEWVQDWYAPDYYATSPSRNPTGPTSGDYRVLRGGSWYDDEWYIRSPCAHPAATSAIPPTQSPTSVFVVWLLRLPQGDEPVDFWLLVFSERVSAGGMAPTMSARKKDHLGGG